MDKSFSVAICVYGKDNANHFKEAMNSILNQTIMPEEVVLVVDGPIPESIQNVINFFLKQYTILKVIYLEENKGYAYARQTALDNCTNELVALMDSDDISVHNRFELQLKAFEEHNDVSVIGGYITEFNDDLNNLFGMRKTPLSHEECLSYSKYRAPINNVTTMYKKSHIMEVGGYKTDIFLEDYYLWVRLLIAGYKFVNIPQNLCYVRIDGMFKRRGGLQYYKNIKILYKYMLSNKLINRLQFLFITLVRFFVHVITPSSLRRIIYQIFARNKNNFENNN